MRLLACTLSALLLICVVTLPGGAGDAPNGAVSLQRGVLLHQTVSSLRNLSASEAEWQRSWVSLGFQLRVADDERARADIAALGQLTGSPDYLRVRDGPPPRGWEAAAAG